MAGYYLQKKDYEVEIFEATRQAGGRCRSYFEPSVKDVIDNGNHLVIGANASILDLIGELGLFSKFNKFSGKFWFYNNERGLFFHSSMLFSAFPLSEKLKFIAKVFLPKDVSVEKHFYDCGSFYENRIKTICTSIMNTEPKIADARMFCRVMRKIILRPFGGLRYYYPKNNWDDALITPLSKKLNIHYNMPLKSMLLEESRAKSLIFDDKIVKVDEDDVVIMATPLNIANQILKLRIEEKYSSILNIHFRVKDHGIPPGIYGFNNPYVDWIFIKKDVFSITKSAANETTASDEEIIYNAWELCKKISPGLAPCREYKFINEKRATFSAEHDFIYFRPGFETHYKNVFLTGDYVQNELPATIEGAVLNSKKLVKKLADKT